MFLAAFGVVSLSTPRAASFLLSRGIAVRDCYKRVPRRLPTMGSLPMFVFLALLLSLLTISLVLPSQVSITRGLGLDASGFLLLLAGLVLVTVLVYGIIGAVDDLVHLGNFEKILLPLLAGLPLALYFTNAPESPTVTNLELIESAISLEAVLPATLAIIFLAPLILTLTANLANMHSGFNGLQTGLTGILIVFLVAKLALVGQSSLLLVPLAFLGGWAAVLAYNWYPARIFEGNMGSFMGGAAIGSLLLLGGFYIAGAIMLIPHLIDFALYIAGRLRRGPLQKHGHVNPDGTIHAPHPFKLKFLLPYYFRLKEVHVVLLLYAFTAVAGAVGLLIPY